jgi:hypothetical protein
VKAVVLVVVPPTVVTDTGTAAGVPEGVLAVILVPPVDTTSVVAGFVPNVTTLAPAKWVPVMVMGVPAAVGPAEGVTHVIVGAGTYVNPVDLVYVPPVVVTTTLTTPTVSLGTVTVIDVDPVVVTVADLPPTVTVAPVR